MTTATTEARVNIRNMSAEKAYQVRIAELAELVNGLKADISASRVDAKSAHWGHIGDVARAIDLAQQLRDVLRGQVK